MINNTTNFYSDENHRYYLVDDFAETDIRKTSSGGMMGIATLISKNSQEPNRYNRKRRLMRLQPG